MGIKLIGLVITSLFLTGCYSGPGYNQVLANKWEYTSERECIEVRYGRDVISEGVYCKTEVTTIESP